MTSLGMSSSSLEIGGEIQLNGASLTAANATAADASVYAGNITGSGAFIKSGLGNPGLYVDSWAQSVQKDIGSNLGSHNKPVQ
ncbi:MULTISPECIES: hypothetical protein [unclassified Serratia (in: enterobacteria)]|uniref:hypothetical protein n=1 Tax=unclassified Serratia (in: enterobacteria) TaxID=2647522 RepID=UPI0030765898